MAGDPVAVVDLLGEALVAWVQHVDVVLLRQQIQDVDVLGAVGGPTRHEDQRLALASLPVSQFHAVVGGKRIDLKAGEIRELLRHARDGVGEREIAAQNGHRRCSGSEIQER